MKKCPFCAEEIQDEAVKCKHCNEFLTDIQLSKKKDEVAFFYKSSFIILAVFVAGPLALPLIWLKPDMKKEWKIGWTVIISVFSYFLITAFIKAMQSLQQYYELLNSL